MATTSTRTTTIQYTGDVTAVLQKEDASNGLSPGVVQLVTLGAASSVTITVPTSGSVPVAVTIAPPAGNTNPIRLKGVGGDTGILLHPTNPMTLSLDPTVTTFVLSGGPVVGIQLIWT